MKQIYLTIIFLISISCFSQVKTSIYTENYIGIEFSPIKKVNTELRVKANTIGSYIESEFQLTYNLIKKKSYSIRTGVGINLFPFKSNDIINSFVFPVNIEFNPFKEYKFISFIFEPSIVSYIEGDAGIRALIGLRFNL